MLDKILAKCEPNTTVLGTYKNNRTSLEVQCINKHSRFIMPGKLLARGDKARCKICAAPSTLQQQYAETFYEKAGVLGLDILGTYTNNHTRVLAKNLVCGHEYMVNPNSLLSRKNTGVTCRVCAPVNKKSLDTLNTELSENNLEPVGEYLGSAGKLLVLNKTCGHTYTVNTSRLPNTCSMCPRDTHNIDQRLAAYNITRIGLFTSVAKPLLIEYACKHTKSIIPTNLFCYNSNDTCQVCSPITTSKSEHSIVEFIKTCYTGWIELQDRSILAGKELDIVLPELGLAIEVNGDYWHSDKFKSSTYHLDKTNQVEEFGYRLIHINESEWLYKQTIVKSRLQQLLGMSYPIPARKTKVARIDFPREFLAENHLQGTGSNSSWNYGLFLAEELVAVMTFSVPRFSKDYDYELIRYCSLLDTTVVGGASKLLKAFRKDAPNKTIVSYSDRRWSVGGLYKTLGFTKTHQSAPSYRYVKGSQTLSRYQTQKHLLEAKFPEFYSPELTESQILEAAGWLRLYDCGNDVWSLK